MRALYETIAIMTKKDTTIPKIIATLFIVLLSLGVGYYVIFSSSESPPKTSQTPPTADQEAQKSIGKEDPKGNNHPEHSLASGEKQQSANHYLTIVAVIGVFVGIIWFVYTRYFQHHKEVTDAKEDSSKNDGITFSSRITALKTSANSMQTELIAIDMHLQKLKNKDKQEFTNNEKEILLILDTIERKLKKYNYSIIIKNLSKEQAEQQIQGSIKAIRDKLPKLIEGNNDNQKNLKETEIETAGNDDKNASNVNKNNGISGIEENNESPNKEKLPPPNESEKKVLKIIQKKNLQERLSIDTLKNCNLSYIDEYVGWIKPKVTLNHMYPHIDYNPQDLLAYIQKINEEVQNKAKLASDDAEKENELINALYETIEALNNQLSSS